MAAPYVAGLVAQMGYKNILVYAEGLAGWKKAGLPLIKQETMPRPEIPEMTASELQGKLGDVNVYVLDVRPASMYRQGHIKGSTNIPLCQLSRRFGEVPTGKKIVLVDYLGRGFHSAMGWFLISKGYTDVMVLKDGMSNWEQEGKPFEK